VKVAVTGGSGVVGTAVVRALVLSGHDVSALARTTQARAKLTALGAKPIVGDVLDPASLDRLVTGSHWVFHVAGVNDICSRDPDQMWRVNVDGTRLVINACRNAGVRRLVHTSSVVTIGEQDGELADENTPHRGSFLSNYERSKFDAERLLFDEASGLDVVSVNPSSVQGPGRATGTGAFILRAARGKMSYIPDTTMSLVDIDDCARGHLLAAERGVTGSRYVLSGATLSMTEALNLLGEITGQPLQPRFLGRRFLTVAGVIAAAGAGLMRRQAPLCPESVRVMTHTHRYDGSKASRDLGMKYTPIAETLTRTVDWFRAEGLLT
jgi:dihydroflavonol-4-reductase